MKNFDIVLHGQVDKWEGTRQHGKMVSTQEEYNAVGSIHGEYSLDAIRSYMMIENITSIEMAFTGSFDSDGKYFIRLYRELLITSDNFLYYDDYINVYVSPVSVA